MKKRERILINSALLLTVSASVFAQSRTQFIDPKNMDQSIKPGDNFYKYANGNWLKTNPIPASETRWGSFSELQEFNYNALYKLLNQAANTKNAPKGSTIQKVGDFYKSGMDSVGIEKKGYEPIKADLKRIDGLTDHKSIINEIIFHANNGGSLLFGIFAAQDAKKSTDVVPHLSNGGLGLPDRDYYLKDDDRSKKIREEYVKHITNMFKLIGNNEADAKIKAENILKMETALAQATMSRVEMRDPNKRYNKLSYANLNAISPLIDWKFVATSVGINGYDTLIVSQPNFFKEVNNQLSSTSIDTWKAYIKWNILRNAAPFLSSSFIKENFNFYSTVLQGQKSPKPRWKNVMNVVDGNIGELLGQMYVDQYFKPEAKQRMMSMIDNMSNTFADRIQRLDWMSDDTKKQALYKLKSFTRKIGYPDKWKDYTAISIVADNYISNVRSCAKWSRQENLKKLGKPVDKNEWGMTPPTVNAYYSPTKNEIVFPAGILQFPFFDFGADDAINYGGIGAVIGHEMTHGFDDSGSKFDAEGNLKNWWTDDDGVQFKKRTQMVVDQYNAYTVINGTMNVNGQLTLGENLADLGGLNIAYEAFMKTKEGQSTNKTDGFTPVQRFFLSWAQVWRANITDEAQAQRILTDPHSPGMYRCNGPLTNMPEFYQAFDVKEGDPMWKPENARAKVW
ncbi:peptidase M13 [Solitalea longa]|uniref:Peptidase M13 n=1 Tax=Solitalea longa TaxID=2079460 RepID=A0A2S5A1R9_9SPHI|nr:M13 family metallopeptidase [Solitalea longa]POY36249.1 peptidase M13 [Solitalea longa]